MLHLLWYRVRVTALLQPILILIYIKKNSCGLLWKAIGIVVLISVVWNGFKLIRWMVTPSPTGLESMPAYDTSLACSSAPFIYKDSTVTESIAVDTSYDHTFDIAGSAVGTLLISQGAPQAEDVIVKMTLRTDNKAILSGVTFDSSSSTLSLTTPMDIPNSCMRYDMTLFIPSNLKHLTINMKSTTQLKVDPEANNFPYLDSITINSHSTDSRSMILPTVALRASKMIIQATGGWIVGELSIGMNTTEIDTTRGDAVTNLHTYPGSSPALIVFPASLKTDSGSGRTDIIYSTTDTATGWHHRRPIMSTHTAHTKSDMYLTYKDARFEGLVDIKSPSYSARNLQTMAKDAHKAGEATHWHGDMEGTDSIKAVGAKGGWIGVYF